ncbi:MAG: transglycosylase SLT domain-containing protein [bacterium]|nr:transglycosylase SLT domain-containing protein [bacterium]
MAVLLKRLVIFVFVLGAVGIAKAGVDEVYQARLAALKSPLELTYNPQVKQFIEDYLNNPEKTKSLISKSRRYFPMLEKGLRAKGIPTELKYLAVAVSELDPSALNASGASGIWMMAYPISKMYKLKVNTYIDERRDPLKSTSIAAQHFKDLFSIYKSWPLAIASYGCSPVTLNKCIHISNNSLYFWDIYPHMPSFCKDLYPRVIATAYIMNYYREHGITLVDMKVDVETDSLLVNKWLSFQQISSVTGVSIEELRELNPVFRKDIIPFSVEGYFIRVPKSKSKEFILLKDSVYRPINSSEILADPIKKIQEESIDTLAGAKQNTTKFSKKKLLYTVKKGDNLGDMADWFDVTAKEIKSWNKLKSNNLKYGQKLIVWVEGSKVGYYKKINLMSLAQKNKIKRKD